MANYKDSNVNNVQFNDIDAVIQLKTGGSKLTRGTYVLDNEGNIVAPQKVINAIDIDWNKAKIIGIENNIESTAQLLGLLGQINASNKSNEQAIDEINTFLNEGGGGDGYKHIVITESAYAALESYDPKTIYFVIEDSENNGGEEEEEFTTDLYVNDGNDETHYTSNNIDVTLIPGKSYEIRGTLIGKIIIDATNLTPTQLQNLKYTNILLNGVQIVSDDNYGIMYEIPEEGTGYKGVSITIEKNTFNSIHCTKVEEIGENQPGAIYSMNNLEIQGAGYLAIQNTGGHGIRGKETTLTNVHLWNNSIHDGVHGKNITIIGGTYYFESCNDAFGTSENGRILYFDGEIRYNTINGQLLDSKQYGAYFNEELLTASELENCTGMHLISKAVFNVLVGRTNEEGTPISEGMTDGKVIGYSTKTDALNGENGHIIGISQIPATQSNSNSTAERGYEITYPFVAITGFIDAPLHFSDTHFGGTTSNPLPDAQIYLRDAYIKTSYNYNSIYYDAKDKGRVKIKAENNTLNIIENTYYNSNYDFDGAENYDSDAIKSENNVTIEANNGSILYITSKGSDGIDGGDIKITDSKGAIIIANCGMRGIKGNAVVIGPTATITQSVITDYNTDPNAVDINDNSIYTSFDGICYVKNNCNYFNVSEPQGANDSSTRKNTGFADIYCRNGKATKGMFGTTDNELKGYLITDSIGYVVKGDFGNAKHFYYNRNISASTANKILIKDPGVSEETYFAKTITNTNINN